MSEFLQKKENVGKVIKTIRRITSDLMPLDAFETWSEEKHNMLVENLFIKRVVALDLHIIY